MAGMSEDNFKEAIIDQYNDLYWDEDLLHDMYEAVTGGERSTRFVTSNSASWGCLQIWSFSLHLITLMNATVTEI